MPQKNSDQFEQLGTKIDPAIVAETGEKVLVTCEDIDNPWGFYSAMWHNTADGRVFHDDELIFMEEQQ